MMSVTVSDWAEFTLTIIKELVDTSFNMSTGWGTWGAICLSCSILGIVARALILKSAHISENPTEINAPSRSGAASSSYNPITPTSYRIESHHSEYIDI